MARSRAKQGNRKNRVKLRNPDGTVKKDARGRIMTIGLHSKPLSNATLARWEKDRSEAAHEARERQAAMEMESRIR